MWTAYATSKVTNAIVTASLAKTGYDGAITVAAFKGTGGKLGATATAYGVSTLPSVSIKAKASTSLIWEARVPAASDRMWSATSDCPSS